MAVTARWRLGTARRTGPWAALAASLSLAHARIVGKLLIGIPAIGLFCLIAQWPLWRPDNVSLAAANLLITVTFYTISVFVYAEPGHRLTGLALAAAALLWPLNWVNEWQAGPLPLIAALNGPLAYLLAVWALLRYPAHWRRRRYDAAAAVLLLFVQLSAGLQVVTSRPEWTGLPQGATWLTWWPSHTAYTVTRTGYDDGIVVVTVLAVVILILRLARLTGPDRRVMRPVLVAIAVAGASTTISGIAVVAAVRHSTVHTLFTLEAIAQIGVPFAFLVAAARRWLAREWVTKLIRDLGPSPTPASVQDALREALDDPTLRLLYRVGGDYVDVDGAPQPASEWHDPRVAVVNPGSSAAVLLIAGPVLVRYHDLVHAAARVAGLALENTSLQAAVSAQIHSVSRSAQRLATAVDAEHRSVQATVRQICDGELAALADQLDTLGRISDTAGLAVQVESARAMLGQARQELTCLAEGVGPAELSQLGLARAVAAAAHRLSPEIAVSVTSAPLDAEIQAAAYLVLAELMTNAVKHAPGSAVTARATLAGSGLLIEVADDGPGGADPGGSGLRGIAERVTSLSGSLTVGSPQGHGTRVTLWLPGAGDCRRAGDLPPPTGYPEDRPHPAYRAPGLLVGAVGPELAPPGSGPA